jgi:hypothetical protein
LVLTTIHEASEAALATVTERSRGLTSEGERDLVQRVAERAGYAVEGMIERRL